MKSYINQFFNEGLATIFCVKPVNYVSKKIKNTFLMRLLIILIKFVYTLLVLSFAIYIFISMWPL